jgi:hypothetical protein
MPVTAKLSMFLEDDSGAGWSDNFYITGTTLAQCLTAGDLIIPNFMAVRPNTVNMIYARYSDVSIRGDSLISQVGFPFTGTYTLGAGAKQMEPGAALLVQLFASATIKGHYYLRGVSNECLSGRDYDPTTAFTTAIGSLMSALVGFVQIRHRVSVGPPPVYNYTNLVTATPERGTTRRVGRPFGLPVGRRKH